MKSKLILLYILCAAATILVSCNENELEVLRYEKADYEMMTEHLDLPAFPINYDITLPTSLGGMQLFDNDKATLGRVLFYDTDLSADRKISCGSCHKQELAFSDDVPFSKGIFDNHSKRNSMPLGSVFSFQVYYQSVSNAFGIPFLWDNSAGSADELSKMAFNSENEMDMQMYEVLEEVNSKNYYKPLIKAATNSTIIDETELLDALSEFVRSIASFNSKFDREYLANNSSQGAPELNSSVLAAQYWDGFTEEENEGKVIYMNDCTACHSSINGRPTLLSANNGLRMNYADDGIITDEIQNHFKVPTLRNIEHTAPYMHDGSIETLDDVIDHYSSGVEAHAYLSEELKNSNGDPINRNYSPEEKSALKAFLLTLTDSDIYSATRYSDPFK